ncbi:MAG: UvrD-helicase domain-containing protein [Actinobacteria bacterium]|nr:UvrD-helicase domain-containing protein [Actinomycetota bacterium]
MDLEKHLNPQQVKAVKSIKNPLLIIAGAGSGKTRVLTYKIAYLIKEIGVDPFNILAITFTNKAAREMKKRVIELVGKVGEIMWVSTFHSFCAKVLRYEIHHLGIPSNFVIYDESDQTSLTSKCLIELDIDNKRFPPKAIHAVISDAKNRLIDYETYSREASDYYEKVVSRVYPLYQQKLIKADALDFDDLLMYMVDILRLYPDVLKKYQEKFKYILVDEFQDTNIAQNELILLLAARYKNIYVVGDDDQSIYSWRGAMIENIISFDKNFDKTEVIKLEQNYRSTKNILSAANFLISNNESRKKKKLWTDNIEGDLISKYMASDEKEEVAFIVGKIKKSVEENSRMYRDFAIFYRTNAQSRAVEEFLIKENIPYKIYGGLRFYDRKEIKDMLAYLKLISNPKDLISLLRVVNVPLRKIGKSTLNSIEKFAIKKKMTFIEAFYASSEINTINQKTKERINQFQDMISDFRNFAVEHGVDETLQKVWEVTGYMKEFEFENTIDAMNRVENLKEFLTVTKEYEHKTFLNNESGAPSSLARLDGFLEEVSLLTDIDNYDESMDALVLMTLHNAKGLEFPVVFIIGMEEGIFPHSRSMNSMPELEEERRLCYVGITRAKEKVFLTSALSHSIYGDTSFKVLSRFIREIPQNLIIDENIIEAENRSKSRGLKRSGTGQSDSEDYSEGDLIEHKMWGRGEVLKVKILKDDIEIDVVFDQVGLKHLLVSFAPIKKIDL